MYICFNNRGGFKCVKKTENIKTEGTTTTRVFYVWERFENNLGGFSEIDINKKLDMVLNFPKSLNTKDFDSYFSNLYLVLSFFKTHKGKFSIKNTGFKINKSPTPTIPANNSNLNKIFFDDVVDDKITDINSIINSNIEQTLNKIKSKIKTETTEKALILNLEDKFQTLYISCRLIKKVLVDNNLLENLPISYNYNSLSSFLMEEFNSFLMDYNYNFNKSFNYNNIKDLKEFKLPLIVNGDYFILLEKFNLKLILLCLENKEKIDQNFKYIILSYISASNDNLSKILLKRFPIFNAFIIDKLI